MLWWSEHEEESVDKFLRPRAINKAENVHADYFMWWNYVGGPEQTLYLPRSGERPVLFIIAS